jgi:hypothetical protein
MPCSNLSSPASLPEFRIPKLRYLLRVINHMYTSPPCLHSHASIHLLSYQHMPFSPAQANHLSESHERREGPDHKAMIYNLSPLVWEHQLASTRVPAPSATHMYLPSSIHVHMYRATVRFHAHVCNISHSGSRLPIRSLVKHAPVLSPRNRICIRKGSPKKSSKKKPPPPYVIQLYC